LRGRLEQFNLATVLSFLDMERRSGELRVITDDRRGRIWLRGGQVIAARIVGTRYMNRAAIYEILSWESGYFAFSQEDLPFADDEIGEPTALLLMNAALRSDEIALSGGAGAPAF
jgi:two-component system OmpR family response regulator